MLLSNACWEMLANWDMTLAWSHVEPNRETQRPWCVGENIAREPDDWQRMLVERTRMTVEKEWVKARWEQRRGGLGGGEEKEQRNRKADVEEVGNWWSRKLGYSCCESVSIVCVCVCVCTHVRVWVWMVDNGSKWNCLSDQYGHHLPDDCGLYWRALINHNQIWRTPIHTNCVYVCVFVRTGMLCTSIHAPLWVYL